MEVLASVRCILHGLGASARFAVFAVVPARHLRPANSLRLYQMRQTLRSADRAPRQGGGRLARHRRNAGGDVPHGASGAPGLGAAAHRRGARRPRPADDRRRAHRHRGGEDERRSSCARSSGRRSARTDRRTPRPLTLDEFAARRRRTVRRDERRSRRRAAGLLPPCAARPRRSGRPSCAARSPPTPCTRARCSTRSVAGPIASTSTDAEGATSSSTRTCGICRSSSAWHRSAEPTGASSPCSASRTRAPPALRTHVGHVLHGVSLLPAPSREQ